MPADHQDHGDDVRGLIQLVNYGQIERARELVESGYDVNVRGEYGDTAAYNAAKRNDFEMLRMLAELGADLGACNDLGQTVLFWAQRHENGPMIEFITTRLAGIRDRPPGTV